MALKKDVFFFLPCKQDTPRIVIDIVTLYEAVTMLHYFGSVVPPSFIESTNSNPTMPTPYQ